MSLREKDVFGPPPKRRRQPSRSCHMIRLRLRHLLSGYKKEAMTG